VAEAVDSEAVVVPAVEGAALDVGKLTNELVPTMMLEILSG